LKDATNRKQYAVGRGVDIKGEAGAAARSVVLERGALVASEVKKVAHSLTPIHSEQPDAAGEGAARW